MKFYTVNVDVTEVLDKLCTGLQAAGMLFGGASGIIKLKSDVHPTVKVGKVSFKKTK